MTKPPSSRDLWLFRNMQQQLENMLPAYIWKRHQQGDFSPALPSESPVSGEEPALSGSHPRARIIEFRAANALREQQFHRTMAEIDYQAARDRDRETRLHRDAMDTAWIRLIEELLEMGLANEEIDVLLRTTRIDGGM